MKKDNGKTIDIILCCYNQERYIEKAVTSILSQKTNAKVRVLIADDCSTDNTLNIIKQLEPQSPFPFVYLNESKNLGLHKNYKRSFGICNADYIAILEGDDWWSENWHLEQHVQFLSTHPRYSMSFNSITCYYPTSGNYKYPKWPFGKYDHVTVRLKHQIAYGNQIGNLSACVFRTELIKKLPDAFFNLKFADWELGIMMALKGPIGLLKESSSVYRINQKGLWSGLSDEKKLSSEVVTLDQITQLLPRYCKRHVRHYKDNLTKGKELGFPMPLQYRIKRIIQLVKAKINKTK